METTTERKEPKRFDKEEDKPFFAAYLNAAKQNVYLVLRDINESLGLAFDLTNDHNLLNKEGGIWNLLFINNKPELTLKVIEKLNHAFPFFEVIAKKQSHLQENEYIPEPKEYAMALIAMIEQLFELRNYYSHAIHAPYKFEQRIIYDLRELFDKSRRQVMDRFNLQPVDTEHLVRRNKDGEVKRFHYAFLDNKAHITEKGLAFFICLWLPRQSAQLLLKQLKGFKKDTLPQEKATLESYTTYSIRLPRPKLNSKNQHTSLVNDMLNELVRCPHELYDLLRPEDQEKFKKEYTGAEDMEEDDYLNTPILKRHQNRFFYFAIRYLDPLWNKLKFHIDLGNYNYYNYTQEIAGVTRIRSWQKHMTSFGHLADFETRPENWQNKTITPVNRKDDDVYVTDTVPHYHINEMGIGLKQTPSSDWPDLTDFNPENANKPRTIKPDYWLSLYELPAIAFYQLLCQRNTQLLSAEHLILRHGQNIRSFFREFSDPNSKWHQGFSIEKLRSALDEKGISTNQLPKPMLKYMLGIPLKGYQSKAVDHLDNLIKETKERIEKLDLNKNNYQLRPSAKDYQPFKTGKIADYLARDMVFLQPAINIKDGKANSTEFQVLQASLAFFRSAKPQLREIFNTCNFLTGANPHPFLSKIELNNCADLLQFYDQYLGQRIKYLYSCMNLPKQQISQLHFVKPGDTIHKNDKSEVISLALELLNNHVMNLPRGIFSKPIVEALGQMPNSKDFIADIKDQDSVNFSYILEKYYGHVLNDSNQDFYQWDRNYELIDKMKDNRGVKEKRRTLERIYLSPTDLIEFNYNVKDKLDSFCEEMAKKKLTNLRKSYTEAKMKEAASKIRGRFMQMLKTEKTIRLHQNCDRVLFLMAKAMLEKELADEVKQGKKRSMSLPNHSLEWGAGYKLSAIRIDSEQSLLSSNTHASIQRSYKYMDEDKERIGSKTIVRQSIKIKNYGDFRALLKDRRLDGLLPFIPMTDIDFEAIRQELMLYEDYRIKAFYDIYKFETKFCACHPKVVDQWKLEMKSEGKQHISHEEILREINSGAVIKIKSLRNAFNHSQYPDYALFKDHLDGTKFNALANHGSNEQKAAHSIISQLYQILKQEYDTLIAGL